MRSNVIVVIPPIFDHDSGFDAITEPFHRQALVPELAVETLVGAVLPGLAGVDEGRLDLLLQRPLHRKRRREAVLTGSEFVPEI